MKMKRLVIFSAIVFLLSGCVKEKLVPPSVSDEEVLVNLEFGGSSLDEVKIGTKATLDVVPESRVSNMFVFVFVGDKRYYAHYFDNDCLKASKEEVRNSSVNCWYVDQMSSATDAATNGVLRIKCPAVTGARIYIMANIDADMVNVSPEKLNTITTLSQLNALTAVLNQEITSRNGLFPMSGVSELVDISSAGIFSTSGTAKVTLERFDAKVKVNFRVATDFELSQNEGGVTTTQRLKEFRPESWCVRKLPKGCYIIPQDSDAEEGYFDTTPVIFETSGTESFTIGETTYQSAVNGFSFYMLENREDPKHTVSSFSEREQKKKDANGLFDSSAGIWTNAPENGTYLEVKGEVVMVVDVSNEAKTQQLAADVTYYIHLGDVASSVNDYSIKRNTIYTYTVTIKGVRSIELEVTTSDPTAPGDVKETEPGAEGMVYIAKESIFTFDAHYGQRVFAFDAAHIDPATVTWYVKTPFGKEGTPDKVGDTEVPSGMDYKWVHFMVNDVNPTPEYSYTYGGSTSTGSLDKPAYSHFNMKYPGDGNSELMDIVQFTKFIKEQKRAYDARKENAFRREFDQDWFDWYNDKHPGAQVSVPSDKPDGPWFRDRIYITVFVDEYYYEVNPITGDADPLLWKRFVNQPNRLMHILCDNQKSLDKASSATGSVITLRQRSIQTPYNIEQDDLLSGWGCETEDENADSYLWFFNTSESMSTGPGTVSEMGNTAVHNGLYNTARIWGVTSGGTWNNVRWDTYLDYIRENDYVGSNGYNIVFLKQDNAVLRYSAMMRNRDNNGNGIIDPEEIRWYTASLGQLQFLYFGELGLNEAAILYPEKFSTATGTYPADHPYAGADKWRCHIVSSTANSGSAYPRILWAEEGLSVSNYRKDIEYGMMGPYSVKCVRNLGFDSQTSTEDYFLVSDPDAEANRPQNMINVTQSGSGVDKVYKFDMTNINDASKRFYTSVELEPYDEESEMARIYQGFETGELLVNPVSSYLELKSKLEAGTQICPEGYRVPNVRELGVMYILCDDSTWWNDKYCITSTYYSLGPLGKKTDNSGSGKHSWSAKYGEVFTLAPYPHAIRCVRDWTP